MPWKHIGSWLQRHGGPTDIDEDSGNPFEGFRGKLDMWSRWVVVEGICWQLAASWLPESLNPGSAPCSCPDNIITTGTLWWCNPLGGPLRISRPIIISSELYFLFHFTGIDDSLRNHSFDWLFCLMEHRLDEDCIKSNHCKMIWPWSHAILYIHKQWRF